MQYYIEILIIMKRVITAMEKVQVKTSSSLDAAETSFKNIMVSENKSDPRVKPEDSSPEDCSILRRALLSPLKPSPKNLYLINPPVEFGTNNVFLQDRSSQTTHMLPHLVTVKEEISEEYICSFPGEDGSVMDENNDKTSDKVSSAETDSDQDDSEIYPVLLCTPDLQVPTNTVSSNFPVTSLTHNASERCNKRNDAHKNYGETIEPASIKDGVTRVDLMHMCKLCNKCFDSQYSLNYHKIFHSKLKHYMCDYCGIFFVRKVLERHLKIHTDERPFECEECGRTFKEKTILRKHLRIHYGERNYMCELCGKKFVSLENLGVHKYCHLDRAIMKMKCQFCERKFATRQRLKKHVRTHSGERPHLCEVCCRGFSSKSHLERHKLTHTEENRFYCNYCNYSFIQKGNFKLHTYTKACQPSFDKTKNEDYSSKPKRRDAFLSQVCDCDICGQHFSKKMYLESHLRSHQNNSN
uniref:(California timema) hypothetical protein n=1 Tax=Timema californicum TaxID=61474 RepID=A0A7R9JCC9_TIMCA|nr:unnamed protein product [Timema californicum]